MQGLIVADVAIKFPMLVFYIAILGISFSVEKCAWNSRKFEYEVLSSHEISDGIKLVFFPGGADFYVVQIEVSTIAVKS